MQKVTFAKVQSRIMWAGSASAWGISRAGECLAFACELVLVSIAMFFYCCYVQKLPMQLQEEELLTKYKEGIDFGRKDTLEKLSQLGPAFKLMPDGAVQKLTDDTAAAAAVSNTSLTS
jgi:hypothetical protein